MFGRGFTLVKLFGFEVKLDLSWLILGVLIAWSLAQGVFPTMVKGLETSTYWLMGAAGAIGLLVSIVFHELWHSLVARRFGLPMKGITLFIFGGVSEMTDEPKSPKVEFLMAIAGPLSSVVLGGAFLILGLLGRNAGWAPSATGVFGWLGIINLILAGFNLVPAFPLDGGRVLRSILWGWKDNIRWATRVASQVGSGFGVVMIIVGAWQFITGNVIGGIWLVLIGMFLRSAARMSYQQLVVRRALEGEKVSQFMKNEPVTVSPKTTIQELVEDYIYKYHFQMFPVVDEGKLVGCVTTHQVKEVPRGEWAAKQVRDVEVKCPQEETVAPNDDAMKALAMMSRLNTSRLMVVEGDTLKGVITLKDMMKLLSLKADLEA